MLVANASYRVIARQFTVGHDAVRRHAENDLKPIIEEANEEAKQEIKEKILSYRAEVNYSTLDKTKLLQEKILKDLESASEISERVALYREFRGNLQEEAKLTGAYQKEKENEDDRQINAVKRIVQQKAQEKGISYEEELRNYLENYAAPEFKEKLSSELVN